MEVKKIEVVKDWLKLKSVRNIQVFLGFANFYWQFIQGFNKIVVLLTLILKTIELSYKPALSRNDNDRSIFGKNNNNKPASRKNNGNNEVNRFGISKNGVEHTKKSRKLFKSGKLSKSRKSKNKKTFKF